MSLSVCKFPRFIRTPVVVYKGPTLMTSFELDYFHKFSIFKYGPMIRCWGLGLYHCFSGGFPSRSPGEGNGNLLRYSCLKNPMDRRTWLAPVHGITESWTRLSDNTKDSDLVIWHVSLSVPGVYANIRSPPIFSMPLSLEVAEQNEKNWTTTLTINSWRLFFFQSSSNIIK